MWERRIFLKLMASVALATVIHTAPDAAWADDGGHDGGHDSDGHEGDGHDGHNDDGHNDDGGGDDNGKDGTKGKNADGLDQDEVLRELNGGKIIPLKTALKIVDARVSGKVIDVKLTRALGRRLYRIKVRRNDGAITTIRLDARTGSLVGAFGF
jgi:uncharacterized membrane protein YkoI